MVHGRYENCSILSCFIDIFHMIVILGGPLICEEKGKAMLTGVFSFHKVYNYGVENSFGMYSSVVKVLPWILDHMLI